LDKWLSTIWPISRADLTKAAKKGCLLVNGTRAKASLMAKDGQKIVFYPPDKPKFPEPPDFVVLYQDEEIFIIDKPAGLIAHPAEAWDGPTLADSLLALDPNLAQVGVPERPGLVHRLDKDTTGVMVVARTPAAYDFLYAAFAERLVSKKYLAFVKGRPQIEGLLETNYGRNPHWRWKMAVLKEGRLAQSFIKVLRHFPEPNVSLVELTLLTGRTHQARVHLATAKSPVLGDHVYGLKRNDSDEVPPALAPFLGRQLLHARRLSFPHPTGGRVAFRAPWPQDFIGLWRELTASA
jgi:23S rRNA pseudouridine1911/1915/1917 synthase